jgi:uncharacterized protein YggE
MPQLNTHLTKTGLAFAAILCLGTLPAPAQMAQTPPPRTITVEGSAEIHVAPDMALVTTGVTTDGDTAAAALTANSTALAKVIEAIRGFGVESKDLQTFGLALSPRYNHPSASSPNEKPRIIGYTVGNEVTARLHDLGKLGDLLDKATLAGANRIDGIAFVVSNRDGLLDDARRRAVVDAKKKADLYAAAGGFALGKVMTLTEESTPPYQPIAGRMMAAAAPPPPVAVPVEAGEATLTVRVRVVYSLAD